MKIYPLLAFGFLALPSILFGAEADPIGEEILRKEALRVGEQRAQAESHYETGVLLYRQQQYLKASEYFRKALSLNPDDQDAKNYLIRVQSVMGVRDSAVSSQSDWLEQNLSVKREAQWADFKRSFDSAENGYKGMIEKKFESTAFKLSEIEGLKGRYQDALSKLNPLEASEEKRQNNEKVIHRLAELSKMETEARSNLESEMRDQSKKKMLAEITDNQKYLTNQINSKLEAAQTELQKENYQVCVEICEDILIVDSSNKKAQYLITLARTKRAEKSEQEIEFSRKTEMSRRLLKIKESFVPYSSSVVYPDNWDLVASRQSQDLGVKEDPAWKRKLDGMLDKYLSYRCPGLPLTEVLSQLSELSGLNIVLSPRVLQERDETELELNEFNYGHMKLRHILQWICREVNLAFILKYDVIYITNKNAATEKTKIRVYDVQDLLSSKQNFAAPSLEDGFVGTEGELDLAAEDIAQEEPISGDVLVEMIQKSIAGNWEAGEGVLIRPLQTGAILIKNTPDVHQQVIELLNTLRRTSALQIEVEARNLTITKGFFRELGFDWTGLNSVSALDAGSAAGFVDTRNENFDIKGAIVNGLASELPGVGFFLEHSILGAFQAKVLMKALEQDQDSTELIAPKLVLVNNILGYIRLGRTQNYISGYELGGGDGGSVGLQPTITSVDEGQLLAVTATVSSDRRYITLRLHPDFQQVTIPRVATVQGTQTTAGIAGDSVTSYNLPVDLPVVIKKQVRTTAVIPDDGVLILGGVSSSEEDKRVRGVPLLSKIPVLGRLFRSDHKSDSSSDSMLLVHGKIIVFDELEADL